MVVLATRPGKAQALLGRLKALTRWADWYDSKLPLFLIVAEYLLILYWAEPSSWWLFARLLAFTAVFMSFGYSVNDLSDMAVDTHAGKPNAMAALAPRWRWLWLLGLVAVGTALALGGAQQLALVLLAFLVAAAYSLPPLRFKERGALGLLVSSAAQRCLPVLVLFGAYEHWGADTVLVCLLYLVLGLRWIVVHQITDLDNDLRTGVRTFAAQRGRRAPHTRLVAVIFGIEVVLLIMTITMLAPILSWIGLVGLALYGLGLLAQGCGRRRSGVSVSLSSFEWMPLGSLYELVLPLLLALCIVPFAPAYAVALPVILGLAGRSIRQWVQDVRPLFRARRPG